MPTYTVISQVDHYPIGAALSPFAVVPGEVKAYGHSLHMATVDAPDADAAMDAARSLRYVHQPESEWDNITATRWTAIGVSSNGLCPTWSVVAVVPGVHEVHGGFESMLSHRWAVIIDNPQVRTVDEANEHAYRQASDQYNQAWY